MKYVFVIENADENAQILSAIKKLNDLSGGTIALTRCEFYTEDYDMATILDMMMKKLDAAAPETPEPVVDAEHKPESVAYRCRYCNRPLSRKGSVCNNDTCQKLYQRDWQKEHKQKRQSEETEKPAVIPFDQSQPQND